MYPRLLGIVAEENLLTRHRDQAVLLGTLLLRGALPSS